MPALSKEAALHGECIADGHDEGKYILSNKEELAYYQKRRKRLLSHTKPLMEIYNNQNVDELLSSLPIYTISEALLDDILTSNHIAASDAETIKNYRKSEIERIKQKLTHSTIYVIISKVKSPSIHFIIRHPRLINALQNFTIPVLED